MNSKAAISRSLCTAVAVLLCVAPFASVHAEPPRFPLKTCHIETGSPKSILGTLSWTALIPNYSAEKWIVFVPNAPAVPGQSKPQTSLVCDRARDVAAVILDLSPAKRQLLQALITDREEKHHLSCQAKYQVVLMPRRLVEGRFNSLVPPLSYAEKQQYLSASETINFNEPVFQRWLNTRGLRKKQESDLEFAWRSFSTIRNAYTYIYLPKQDRHITKLCQEASTDCGGLSWLFVGVLRANGVPARSLIGRWAKSGSAPGVTDGATHVRAEFYATGVGWIPVEMSGAVEHKATDPLRYFGLDHGNFVTFHIDPDFVLDTKFCGEQSVRNLQSPAFWVTGPGTIDGMSTNSTWEVKGAP